MTMAAMTMFGWLAAGTIVLWALLIYPAWLWVGDAVWLQSLAALVLCLLPAWATLLWTVKAGNAPEKRMVAVLGGTGIRMAVALGGGLALVTALPTMFSSVFWIWLVVFYMFILTFETILVVRTK